MTKARASLLCHQCSQLSNDNLHCLKRCHIWASKLLWSAFSALCAGRHITLLSYIDGARVYKTMYILITKQSAPRFPSLSSNACDAT
jgi:hypothetical protein